MFIDWKSSSKILEWIMAKSKSELDEVRAISSAKVTKLVLIDWGIIFHIDCKILSILVLKKRTIYGFIKFYYFYNKL